MDVGGLSRGTISVQVEKPQFSEAFPDAVTREGADEPTLRAEEEGTQRAFINTKHIELGGDRRQLVRTGTASVKSKELEETNGKSCTVITEN